MGHLRAAFCAALLFLPSLAQAQDITLRSPDGTVEITGNLLGYDGEFYRVDTPYGELTVDGTGVHCEGPACPSMMDYIADIHISGAPAMGDILMPALIESFALRNGYQLKRSPLSATKSLHELADGQSGKTIARFYIQLSTSDEGFADLLADEADIAMSLREINGAEARRGAEAGLGDMSRKNRSRVIALDAIVPIVAPENPVRSITPRNLAHVFAGKITNWADLGGPNAPISLHSPHQDLGTGQTVHDRLLAPAKTTLSQSATQYTHTNDLVAAVARDPFAIGLAVFSDMGNAQPLALTGSCGFSMQATRAAIKTEDYPLSAPMFLYLPERRLPKLARDFLRFSRSPSAQIVVQRSRFVDQAAQIIPINAQGDRLANAISIMGDDVRPTNLRNMIKALSGFSRLSTSFRFHEGSSTLDAQSRSNVHQLARAIETGRYDARELMFVGFSDGNGPASTNKTLSEKRAKAVRDAVIKAAETADLADLAISVAGFGETLPMACDSDQWGQRANRRVEVWVR